MKIKDRILSMKKWYSIVSSLIFLSLLVFCTYVANLELNHISLSEFGINKSTGRIWNSLLFIIGILLYVESVKNIIKYFNEFYRPLMYTFSFSIFCLLATSLIDMNYEIHNYTAFMYFIGFSSSIFVFGLYLLKTHFRIGITSIVISIMSVIIPILFAYLSNGLAIPEIAHTTFILLWIIITSYDIEYQSILKKIGF